MLEESFVVVPLLNFTGFVFNYFSRVRIDAFFRGPGHQSKVQAFKRSRSFGCKFLTDTLLLFEAFDLVASCATVLFDRVPSGLLQLWIVHVIRIRVGHLRRLRKQIGCDIPRILHGQPQVRHDCHILDLKLGAVIGTLGMKICVEYKWEFLVFIVLPGQIPIFFGTIWSEPCPWIVNPPHNVIITRLLPNLRQVRGKVATSFFRTVTNGMTSHAADLMKQLLPTPGIPRFLLWHLAVKPLLPQIRSYCLSLNIGALVMKHLRVQSPERRHFCSRPDCLWLIKPFGNPFFPKLQPNVF